jgi:hypothetical protein
LRPHRRPDKANPKLAIDSNAVLAAPISSQGLELIAWWNTEPIERHSGIELIQLSPRDGPNRVRTRTPRRPRVDAIENILAANICERLNHDRGSRTRTLKYNAYRYT